jgi:hypothetical protein
MRRAVHVAKLPSPEGLAVSAGWPIERVLRAEPLARWVLAAVADLVREGGPLAGAGILVGESFATLETNASFFARLHSRGTRMAEPRKFPYTSPNAAGGDAGVAFGLTGLSFAVGSGMHAGVEALVVGAHLVASGDVDTLVVVAADDVGPTVARMASALGVDAVSGAIGVVLARDPGGAVSRVAHATCGLGHTREAEGASLCGHRALLPLVRGPVPTHLAASSPPLPGVTGSVTGWARLDLASPHEI